MCYETANCLLKTAYLLTKSCLGALDIREPFAQVNPQIYLPDVALTLNNLGLLQTDKNEFAAAEKSYQKALSIHRAFAEAIPQAFDLRV
jgi:tetratricopeptide (TPR) repeat protein